MINQKIKARWFLHLRNRNLSEHTLNGYSKSLRKFEAFTGGKTRFVDVKVEQVEAFTTVIRKNYKWTTLNNHLAALKSFYGWLYDSGLIIKDIAKAMPKMRKERVVLKNVPTIQEVKRLILTPDINTLLGYRDRTMILLTYSGGLRSNELRSLNINDVDVIKETITITRKGDFTQEIPVGALAMEYLSTFINEIRPHFSPSGDWVFTGKGGERIERSGYGHVFKKYAKKASLGFISPHSLRHAAATHMTKNGADIRAVQYFLGHKDIESTAIYTKIDPVQVREVIDRIS